MTHLPHRFSEKSFRRYEGIIYASVERFPQPTVVNPLDITLSAETVRGRLRDAITSLKTHSWQTTIPMDVFLKIHDSIVVSLRPDGKVVVGDKDTVKLDEVAVFSAVDPTTVLDCTQFTDLSLATACYLAHNRALGKKLKLKLLPEIAKQMTENYDILLVEQQDNIYLLS